MTGTIIVAAFDVDGTLTSRDCVVPFLRRFVLRRSVVVSALRQVREGAVAVGRRDRDRLRIAATSAVLAGVAVRDLDERAADFAASIVANRLRDDTVGRLRWHVGQGHRVVLVSASYEVYLRPLAEHLGAEAVLGTRLEIDTGDVCTGRLAGRNCRAAEKVHRLDEWLALEGIERTDVDLWAYGDSPGDRELLAAADHPVWVDRPLDSFVPVV